eukprot:GAFH01002279.1.p2 GENE.GAFH01002279.1~~GAFH01002279.1.p2  ORF type:complete len:282 (-),score=80.65 GAFH01002279.1:376-1188(-)
MIQPVPGQPQVLVGVAQPMMAQPQPMMVATQPMMAPMGQPMMMTPMMAVPGPMTYQQAPMPPGGYDHTLLAPHQRLVVKQEIEIMEVLTGFETQNHYSIFTPEKQRLFMAAEQSDFCARCCLGGSRPFTIKIVDVNTKQEILTFQRDCKCYFHEIRAFSRAGALLGYVKRNFSCCERNYQVYNAAGQPMYFINGPCCSPWTFDIVNSAGQQVGSIKKKWGGVFKEVFTDADTFSVEFPPADPDCKAVILGAVFLIDFMYFEDNQKNNNNN